MLKKVLAFTCLTLSIGANAAPITDTVIRGAQEWAQVDLFTNNNWNTINSQCPSGVCLSTAEINGWDLDGWTWASIDAVQTLFNTFTGQSTVAPGSYFEENALWAPVFMTLFDPTKEDSAVKRVFGWSSTGVDFKARAAILDDYSALDDIDQAITFPFIDKTEAEVQRGAWFVRDVTPVPIPAAAWLFGSALLGLGVVKRRKAQV